jgi:hypothetical protein
VSCSFDTLAGPGFPQAFTVENRTPATIESCTVYDIDDAVDTQPHLSEEPRNGEKLEFRWLDDVCGDRIIRLTAPAEYGVKYSAEIVSISDPLPNRATTRPCPAVGVYRGATIQLRHWAFPG